MEPDRPKGRTVFYPEGDVTETPAPPESGPDRWMLKLRYRRYFDRRHEPHNAPQSIDLTEDQGRIVGRILSLLQVRLGLAPGMELQVDAQAHWELASAGVEAARTDEITHAWLVREPPPSPPGHIKRSVVIVPFLLVPLLLLLAGFLLFFTDQGKDLLRSAEEGRGAAALVGTALIAIPAALFAVFAHSTGDGRELTASWATFYKAAEGPASMTAFWGGLVGGLADAISPELFGWWTFVYMAGFAALGFALCFGFLALMSCPRWSAAVGGLVLLVIGVWPAEAGVRLGSPLVLAIMLSAWAVLLAALIHWYRHANSVEWFWLALVGAVVVSLLVRFVFGMPPDTMRGMPRAFKEPDEAAAKRPDLAAAYDEVIRRQPGRAPVIVIVAAAGGGIKASYWTSKVLGRATDQAPVLARAMLAGSGVSGGSLGLAFYRSLLEVESPTCDTPDQGGALERCAAAFHRRDLLAGLIGASGTTEVVNSLLPLFPRRSVALERTWEVRWRDSVRAADGGSADDLMARPFASLWRGGRATPALILNTTRPLTGDRVAVSNLDLTGVLSPPSACAANIAEHLDLPLSTAVNASARFPLVEEWGWFRLQRSVADCDEREAIADGGFYDNYGAATALDVYWRVKELTRTADPAPRIIVVQISSEVDCRLAIALDGERGREAECADRRKRRRELLALRELKGALFSPEHREVYDHNINRNLRKLLYPASDKRRSPPGLFGTALNAVSITGLGIASRLCDDVTAAGDDHYHFSLAGALDLPLGWSLSRHARQQIDEYLLTGSNKREMDRLVRVLTMPPPKAAQAAEPPDARRQLVQASANKQRRPTCAERNRISGSGQVAAPAASQRRSRERTSPTFPLGRRTGG